MSVPDLSNPVQARIYFTSNFVFTAGATIDFIEFNDVYMVGDNYGARFVFNNSNSANVGKISFTNSRIEIFRGVVRLQAGTTTVNDLVINNCIIDSVGSYSVLNIQTNTSRINNILITNSTFYKIEALISSANSSNSVDVSDCTFNEAPLGNSKNYYVDFGSNVVSNGFFVRHSIFGIGKNSAGAFAVKDYRVGSGTTITTGNNYRTFDHASAGNDFAGITIYNRTAAQLWQDPANGNFKIADATYPGRNTTGDPRWR